MKAREIASETEEAGLELKDQKEDGLTITSPNLIMTSYDNGTPKNSSSMVRYTQSKFSNYPETNKTPGVIEVITPDQTPEVGGGLFECGKFPDSSTKGKNVLNSSISMRNIDFTCEKDYIPIGNQQLCSDSKSANAVSVYTNEKARPMAIHENLYSPNAPSEA